MTTRKTLTLMRHGKSSWADSALMDFDRPLNDRGRSAAQRIGREMRSQGLAFDRILASPAARIRETLLHLAKGHGDLIGPDFEPGIYEASGEGLFELLRRQEERWSRLLLVGHQPGLGELALRLVREADPMRGKVAAAFPTAATLMLDLGETAWAGLGEGSATIRLFWKPRDLAADRPASFGPPVSKL